MGHYNCQFFATPFAVKHPYSRAAYRSTPKRFNATRASGFSINLTSVAREQLWAIGIDSSNMERSRLEIGGLKLAGLPTKTFWRSVLWCWDRPMSLVWSGLWLLQSGKSDWNSICLLRQRPWHPLEFERHGDHHKRTHFHLLPYKKKIDMFFSLHLGFDLN